MLEKFAAILSIMMQTKKWSHTFLFSFLLLILPLHFSAQKSDVIYVSGDASIHSSDEVFNSALEKSADVNNIIVSKSIVNNVEKIIAVSETEAKHLASKNNQKLSDESEVIKIAKKQKKEQLVKRVPIPKVEAQIFVYSSESNSTASRNSSNSEHSAALSTSLLFFGKGFFNAKLSITNCFFYQHSPCFEFYYKNYSSVFYQDSFARPPPTLIFHKWIHKTF